MIGGGHTGGFAYRSNVPLPAFTLLEEELRNIKACALPTTLLYELASTLSFQVSFTDDTKEINGFGLLRRTYHNGLFVGPLYADSAVVADHLLAALIRSVPNLANYSTLKVHVPSGNRENILTILNTYAGGNARVLGHMVIQFTDEKFEVRRKGDKTVAGPKGPFRILGRPTTDPGPLFTKTAFNYVVRGRAVCSSRAAPAP